MAAVLKKPEKKKPMIGMPSIEPGMNKKVPGDPSPPPNAKENNPGVIEFPDKNSPEELKAFGLAKKRFEKASKASAKNNSRALEDLKFKAGDQWNAEVSAQRAMDKRPCLTINTIPTITHQITNDIRENRPAIHISPVGDRTDKDAAKMLAGMIRAIERDSAADIAYDTAITSAVDIGFGYLRVLTEYEDEKSLNQVVTIKRVRNPFTVYLDPMRQEPDGADAEFAFVSEWISRDEFDHTYPEADRMHWQEKGVGDSYKDWIEKDQVRIAEYFCIEKEHKRLVQLSNGFVGFYDDIDTEVKDQIKKGKLDIIDERVSECRKVVWRKLSGVEVLEKRQWAGAWIPIVEFIGEEIDIQGEVIYSGVIRNAKDSQRMKNYWASYKTEVVALAPKAPYIGAAGQFEGYEEKWKTAVNRSYPYLEYNAYGLSANEQLPPPQRVPPSPVPAGIVEAEQSTERDMMVASGIKFIGTPTNERLQDESGLALRELRRNNDIGSFHFTDNAARSIRQVGRILVDLIPKIYDTRRVVTILREDDTEQRVTIDPNQQQPVNQNKSQSINNEAMRTFFNPKVGKYMVTVTIGPSYATKRIEAHDQMVKLAQAIPALGQNFADLMVKYSDWPGAEEISKRFAKLLPPQLLMPEEKDIPPQLQTVMQNMQKQIAQLMQERMQMLRDITDNRVDQATKRLKVENDYKTKLLKIITDLQSKALELTPQDLGMAQAISSQYPPGFNPQIPDPMPPQQADPGHPGNPLVNSQQLVGGPGHIQQMPSPMPQQAATPFVEPGATMAPSPQRRGIMGPQPPQQALPRSPIPQYINPMKQHVVVK